MEALDALPEFVTSWSFMISTAVSAGGWGNDTVSLIDVQAYFQSRNVPVNAPEMTAHAARDPKDGKTQIEQLLALRWLADHPEMTKSVGEARGLLAEIAEGKRAQAAQGFAKQYAPPALPRLDGKAPPAPQPIPATTLPP